MNDADRSDAADEDEGLVCVAWLYKAFGSKLGILQLHDDQLSLTLSDGGTAFDASLDDVEVLGWPSYGLAPDSQVKLKVAGKKHRVCFVAPTNAPEMARDGEAFVFGASVAQTNQARRALGTYKAGQK